MNLQQLRFVRETIRQNFNLTEAAKALYTSQPGVSKAIIELEDELGVEIFHRYGKRIRGLTEPGKRVAQVVETIMREIDNLKQIAEELNASENSRLMLGTSYAEAGYFIPRALAQFLPKHPKVEVSIRHGTLRELVEYLRSDIIEIALVMETDSTIEGMEEIAVIPLDQWEFYVVVPHNHPLKRSKHLTMKELTRYPIITYASLSSAQEHLQRTFGKAGVPLNIQLSAMTADAIKAYVELGMGVGIIVSFAYDPERDKNLHGIPAKHLFGTDRAHMLLKKNTYLRNHVCAFAEQLSNALNRRMLEHILNPGSHADRAAPDAHSLSA